MITKPVRKIVSFINLILYDHIYLHYIYYSFPETKVMWWTKRSSKTSQLRSYVEVGLGKSLDN